MKRMMVVLLPLLAACAAPQPIFKPVTVDVAEPVPCKAPAIPKPDMPLQHVAPDAPLFDKARAALIELDTRKAYETRLEAALNACR